LKKTEESHTNGNGEDGILHSFVETFNIGTENFVEGARQVTTDVVENVQETTENITENAEVAAENMNDDIAEEAEGIKEVFIENLHEADRNKHFLEMQLTWALSILPSDEIDLVTEAEEGHLS
jgi:hypothetical protein